jgi:hypothetical protein
MIFDVIRKVIETEVPKNKLDSIDSLQRLRSGHILMGQTFDDGQPLDILKYALVMGILGKELRSLKVSDVKEQMVLADSFMYEINTEKSKAVVDAQVGGREAYIRAINAAFGSQITTIKSSELNESLAYKSAYDDVIHALASNKEFTDELLLSIPLDHRVPGAEKYPAAELATILALETDIKIGPVYEKFYDVPADKHFAKHSLREYVGLHITKGFPFGKPNMSKSLKESIDSYGVLPYKIQSKNLRNYRIDPIHQSLDVSLSLIESTKDPRALVDLLSIATLSRAIRNLDSSEYVLPNDITQSTLQKLARDAYKSDIFEVFHGN